MNRGQIRGYARNQLNEQPGASTFWTDGELNDYINAGYAELLQDLLIDRIATGTVAQGVSVITLPVDVAEVRVVTVQDPAASGDDFTFVNGPKDIRQLEMGGARLADQGRPFVWYPTVDGSNNPAAALFFVPDKTYNWKLYYTSSGADFASDSDVPIFDRRYHHILAYFCLKEAWAKGGRRPDLSDGFEQRWNVSSAKARADLIARRSTDNVIQYVDPGGPRSPRPANDPLSSSW